MRCSHDENGSIQMNMNSLSVIDLDLSISPDVFGLRAFDAAINTLRRRASDVEHLCRDAPKRADKAFHYGGPGFCGICNIRIYSALDAHMIASHLELGQLWWCPVTWCAVWKGSGRACLEHLAEKHGGSALKITTNVAQFFPPWTVTRDVWHDALRPDVTGIAVDALLFHEAGSRLVHRYRVYKDPFPHSSAAFRCGSGHGYRPTNSPPDFDPVVGGPCGTGAHGVLPQAPAPISQARRVSFANEVTTLNEEEINTLVLCRNWCGCLLFLNQQYRRWIEKLQYLGGGWPGRVRSSKKGLRSLSIRWGLVVPSGTPHTVFRTMRSRLESTDFS